MKYILIGLLLLSIVGCTTLNGKRTFKSTASLETELIESTMLSTAKMNGSSWEPIELKKLVSDEERFKAFNFHYEALNDIPAFGGRVKYIYQMEDIYHSGPSVIIDAPTHVVADYITSKYHLKFKNHDEKYEVEIAKDLFLKVTPHSTQKNVSTVWQANYQ